MAPFVDLIVSVIATGFVLAAVWSVVWLVRTYHRPVTATRVRPERVEPIDYLISGEGARALKDRGGATTSASVTPSPVFFDEGEGSRKAPTGLTGPGPATTSLVGSPSSMTFSEALVPIGGPPSWESVKRSDR